MSKYEPKPAAQTVIRPAARNVEFKEQPMRPPQEAESLLIRLTQGCTHNKCNFCYISRGHSFAVASPEQVEAELLEQKQFYPANTKVYFLGSNPFALSAARLEVYISLLRRHFPEFAELSMHARITDIARKSAAELEELRAAGITHLYIGTENGNDEALRLMNKGSTADEAVEQLLRLDEAGIGYVTFYVLGFGGRGQGRACGADTAEMFNRIKPRRITTTGLTVFPGTPLAEMTRSGKFAEASEKEKLEELLVFFERLETETVFDSVHYLNPLNLRFDTRRNKDLVMGGIKDFLAAHSEEEIEKMVGRESMLSL